jgi:hypothetical protein
VLSNIYEPALPVEWRRLLGKYPNWRAGEIEQSKQLTEVSGIPRKPPQEWLRYHYEQFDSMMIGRPTLTLTTVLACFDSMPDWVRQLLAVNLGAVQQYVAALIAYIAMVSQETRGFILDNELHLIPHRKWVVLKPALEASRAVMAVNPEDTSGKIYLELRKCDLLAGRSIADADYGTEERKMANGLILRFWPQKGRSSMDEYAVRLDKALNDCCRMTLGNSKANVAYDENPATWWMSRSRWTASGSSSLRQRVDTQALDSKTARPSKKSVAEALTNGDLYRALASSQAVYRGSTKPEPGFKQRALYAQDDLTYTRDAYVSRDIEKKMVGLGLMARQAAADVAEWVDESTNTRSHQHWLSLDYSDFNKEHNAWELILVDMAVAKNLNNTNRETRNMRILLGLASAATRKRSFIKRHGYSKRVYSGLFSGHRNTARDNTLLHAAYSHMVVNWAEENFHTRMRPDWVGICGDDEDTKRTGLASTVAYLGGHQLFGWTLNPKKQLVSFKWHEFLQRFTTDTPDPSKPLARNISALSTGNWYTMPGKYWDTAVASVTDFGAEMVARGANWAFTRRLLAGYLDTYFNDGTSRRSWHHQATALDRLFWEKAELSAWEDIAAASIADDTLYRTVRALPTLGVQDMIKRDWHILQKLKLPDLDRIKWAWAADSHASLLNPTDGKSRQQQFYRTLPERKSHTVVQPPTREPPKLVAWPKLTTADASRTELNSKDLLNRVGLDRRVLEALGGWDNLAKHGLGSLLQYWEPTRPSTIKPDTFCDWAILAHYSKYF